jgi:hypothetical protein
VACLCTVVAGAFAFASNDESYDTHFSTIARMMQNEQLKNLFSDDITESSTEKRIERSWIQLKRKGGVERFWLHEEGVPDASIQKGSKAYSLEEGKNNSMSSVLSSGSGA